MLSGTQSVAYLRFSTAFGKFCDHNEASEPDALKIWSIYISRYTRSLFDSMKEYARSNVDGFSDYPGAGHFFLCTYAENEYLEEVEIMSVGI